LEVPNSEHATLIFYAKLFEKNPSLKVLNRADMAEQGKKQMTMIATAVNGLSKLDEIVPAVKDLGTRHAGYGVTDSMYDTVGAALIETLEVGLGEQFTDQVKEAWIEAYTILATTMKNAVSEAENKPGLTPFKIKLVQDSFKLVVSNSEQTAAIFYHKLFEKDPSLKKLFSGDMKEQGKKLMAMIATAVNGLTDLGRIVPAVKDLGVRHAGYGVTDSMYDTVGAALLETLEVELGKAFSPTVKNAWTEVYITLATTMKNASTSVKKTPEKKWFEFWK